MNEQKFPVVEGKKTRLCEKKEVLKFTILLN